MVMLERRVVTEQQLMDLERTVNTLHGQLREVQWELKQTKGVSLTERLWRNLISSKQGNEFMSAVCNRRARPNTKVVNHVGTTTGH
jgi:hypothetical protein